MGVKYFLQISLSLYLIVTTASVYAQQSQKPNIVFIISDDHAYQAIDAYGSTLASTPNIDRIAKEGAIFRNSFVTNSLCGPSRATLITGKYSHLNGYKANEGKFNVNQEVFPTFLQAAGYQTAYVGKWHLGTLPKGFNYFNILQSQGAYFNPEFINTFNDTIHYEGYVSDLITKFSLDWLNSRDQSKPFCIIIGHKATHRNWLPAVEDLGAYDDVDFPVPSTFNDDYKDRVAAQNQEMQIGEVMRLKEDLKVHVNYEGPSFKRMNVQQKQAYINYYEKKISKEFDEEHLSGEALTKWKYERFLKDYLSTAKSLDRNIGKVLDYLDSTGLSKNTVVIYVSDQSFYLGEHGWFDKRFMYEESLRTPFVMRYPGVIKQGMSIDKFAVNIDWAPTLLDIAGVKAPVEMQGKSLLPLLEGKHVPWTNQVYYHYYEFPQPHHVQPHFGVRTEDYKLICFYGDRLEWELFDLKKDVHELNNVYGKQGYEKITEEMKQELVSLIQRYKDDEALKIIQAGHAIN